jgi:hypothetical protein
MSANHGLQVEGCAASAPGEGSAVALGVPAYAGSAGSVGLNGSAIPVAL